jgi:flagellar biosynthesis protein FlhF
MIIKTFTAESVAAALKQVRREMGSEATVLRTRRIASQNREQQFEVTACIDDTQSVKTKTVTPETPLPESTTPLHRSESSSCSIDSKTLPSDSIEPIAAELGDRMAEIESKLDRLLRLESRSLAFHSQYDDRAQLHRRLLQADLPPVYVESFITAIPHEDENNLLATATELLVLRLSSLIEPNLSFHPGDKVLFIGPAGGGKSSVMGKLAARLVAQDKQKVTLATLDYYRIAAHEELASYADVLQTPVVDLTDNQSNEKDNDAVTLIDSPPVPTRSETLDELKKKVAGINPDYRLVVFSALTRSRDIEAMSAQLQELQPTHLVMTMFDLTDCYGSAVAAAQALGIKISFLTDSPGGVGQLKSPEPARLAQALLNGGGGR